MAKSITKAVKVKTPLAEPFYKKYPLQLIVILFPLLLFTNSLFNDYNMDDELVTINHRLTSKGISAIPEIFTSPYYQDESGYAYEYRPVPLTTFAIEHSLFGDKPFISHFINLLFYCLLCFSLFRFLVSIGGEITPLAGLCITLLFCAHPSHTEVVCSIKNRDEILGLLLCILSAHLALIAARKKNWWLIAPTAILFLLAMLCKSTFVPFAFFIPLAIILFSESALLFTTALTVLLSVAVYATLDVNPPHYKMWLIILLITGMPVIQLIFKGVSFAGIRTFFKSERKAESDTDEPFSGLKVWYSRFDSTAVYSLLPIAVIFIIYLLVFRDSWLSLILIITLLLVTSYLHLKNFKYWNLSHGLLLSMIILGIETIGSQTGSPDITIENALPFTIAKHLFLMQIFPLVLAILFFWGKAAVRLPALVFVALIIFYFGDFRQVGDIFGIFVIILFSRIVMGRYLLGAAFFVFAGSLLLSIYAAFHSNQMKAIDYSNIWGLIITALLLFKGNALKYLAGKINFLLVLLSIVLAIFLIASDYMSQIPYVKIQSSIYNDKDYLNVAESVVETPTDRPLQFVEFPIAPGAPKDLKTGTALVVMGHYLLKIIIPYPLSYYYGYAYIKPTGIIAPGPLLALVLHLAILFCALFLFRKNKYFSFGLIIYLLSALIISGYFIPIPGIVADRYLSIPTIGWSIVLALILIRIWKLDDPVKRTEATFVRLSLLPKGFVYSLIAILSFYSVITFSRNLDWRDNLTLFRHDIKYVENSAQAHNLLAVHLMKRSFDNGDPIAQKEMQNEALGHFRSAIQIYPEFYNVAFDLGRTYSTLNNPDSAVVYFKKAISIDSTNSDAHLYVAKLLAGNNRQTEAIPYFEYRISHVPGDYEPYGTLSYIYYNLKEYEKSIAVNRKATRQFPASPDPVINIGRTFKAMNQTDSARAYYQKSLILKPNNPEVLILLQELNTK